MQKQQDVYGNIVKIYQLEIMMMKLLNLHWLILLIHLRLKQKSQVKLKMMEQKMLVPLKYLSNFWRTLEMPLINCEVNLILTWSSACVLISTNIPNQAAIFEITDTKLYVPVVTLSTQENTKFLQQLKSGFKRVIN